jgi:hypothetical protein
VTVLIGELSPNVWPLNSLQEHQIGIRQYKTSGDFSFENADYLAVTDKYVEESSRSRVELGVLIWMS